MDKREFLKLSALASGTIFIPGFLKGIEQNPLEVLGYKHLVIIQLSGGNDGLNTVIPFSQGEYYKQRSAIGIEKNRVLRLTDDLGLNPELKNLKSLYDQGEVSIINSVGYPNPNRSHFRSMDIWHSGSDSNEYLTTGWLGRYMDSECSYHHNVVEIDRSLSLAVKGESMNALAFKNSSELYKTTREAYFHKLVMNAQSETLNEDNLGYLYKTMINTNSSSELIHEKTKTYKSNVSYPSSNLAKKLKTSAELINSGMESKVHYVTLSGFDTHAAQNVRHSKLLAQYDSSVSAFVRDLKASRKFKDTLIMTFSEFGRRVKENGSRGTDHGTAGSMFLIGGAIRNPGCYNGAPDLLNLDKNGDLIHQVDFRQVYSSVLQDWLQVDSKKILGRKFEPLKIL